MQLSQTHFFTHTHARTHARTHAHTHLHIPSSSPEHGRISVSAHTPDTQRRHSPPQKTTKVTSKYSAPSSSDSKSGSLSLFQRLLLTNLESISSF